MSEIFDALQGETNPLQRIREDDLIRRSQQPKTPSAAPTLASSAFTLSDGGSAAAITVTWSPVRKDMDYIIRWKKTTDSGYTYERSKTSPHIIRPVETGVNHTVAFALERRQYGTRGQFSADEQVTSAPDPTAPASPSGLSCTTSPATATIRLSWTPNTEADLAYYSIYRDTSSPATTLYTNAFTTSWEDVNATPGTTYFYRIRAVDRSGNQSGFSNETSCTVAFLGTLTVTPAKTAITSLPASLGTALSQAVQIPAGSQFLNAYVGFVGNSIVGAGSATINVRFRIGSHVSNTASIAITGATLGTQFFALLTSATPLSVSGTQTLIYEWSFSGATSVSGALTSPGSIQVTA